MGVTAVYPGPVLTRIFERGRWADESKRRHEIDFISKHAIAPERVAERIVRGVERDAPRVLIGKEPYAMDLMQRLAPDLTGRLLARLARRLPFV